jgi:SnoaL-like protein
LERIVQLIVELANRGRYAEALEYYLPQARLDLGGGEFAGGYDGKSDIRDLIEIAIKEYGRPRVTIDDIHSFGPKVFVETTTRVERGNGHVSDSREIHVFEFVNDKVGSHRIFTNAIAPPRLRGDGD